MKMRHFVLLLALVPAAGIAANMFGVEWDPVDDSRVGKYVVGVGPETGNYTDEVVVDALTVQADIPDLGLTTYWVAVKACTDDRTLCSEWSNEISESPRIFPPGNARKRWKR